MIQRVKNFSVLHTFSLDYLCIQGEVGLPGPPGLDGEKVKEYSFHFVIKD